MKKIYKHQLLGQAVLRTALFLGVVLWGSISAFAQTYNLPITGTDAVRCGAGELTLVVEEVTGVVQNFDANNVKWYDVPFYGEPIDSGLTHATGYIEFTQTYYVDYLGADGCSQCDRLLVRAVIENQTITPNVIYSSETFCNSADSWFTPSVVGSDAGDFSITPSVGTSNFDTSNGSFKPYNLTAGTYELSYQPDAITGCNSDPVLITLTVTDAPVTPEISYVNAAYCVDEGTVSVASQTGATGGTYSAVPDGLALNATSGAITLSTSVEGNYTVSYIVPAGGGCSPVSATTTIRVDAASVGGDALAESSLISSGTGTTISLVNYVGSIQWQSSIDNSSYADITNENSASLNTGILTSTTYYRAVVTNGVCGSTYSDTATVTVSAASVAGIATASSEEICDGSTTTLTLSDYTGNIQWQSDVTGSFVDIPGETSATYTSDALAVSTPGTDRTVKYRAVVTEGLSAPDISNEVSITVRPDAQPGLVVGSEICSGADGTVTVFDQLGDSIQWQSSASIDGVFTSISGATSATYTAIGLSDTTYYRAQIFNGPCNVVYTETVSIEVNPPSIAGTASADLSQMCEGGTADIQLTGYTGSISWEYLAPGSDTWSYSGGNAAFTTNALTSLGTHQFKAKVTSGVCSESYSNTISIEVVAQPSWDSYTAPSASITYGESVTFAATVADGLGGTISWIRSTSSGGAGLTVTSPDTPTAVGTYYYRPAYSATGENCGLADGTEYTVVVGQKELTVTNALVTTKTYDGNTTATITGATLSGLVLGDTEDTDVSLDNDASGTFASANVGTNNVTTTMTISGDKAGNYTLTQPTLSGEITEKALSITAPTIASKVYDGATTAGAVTVGTLYGFVGDETVTASGTAADYTSADVGDYEGTVITYTLSDGTNGGLATNYSLANGTATGTVTEKALSITAPTIASKVYDGATAAGAVTVGTLSGFVGDETVTASGTAANYTSADVGDYEGTVITYTLSDGTNGGLATNYSLANGTATGTINAKQLTISGTTISADKTYDGNTSATVTANGTLDGIVNSEDVAVTASANYSTPEIGTGIGITVDYTLGGTATLTNYIAPVDNTTDFSGNITAPNVQVTSTTVDEQGGGYTDLQAAFDAINIGTHTGVITVRIFVSTTEDATATLNASGTTIAGGTSSYTSVTIIAEADVTVSGAGIILGN